MLIFILLLFLVKKKKGVNFWRFYLVWVFGLFNKICCFVKNIFWFFVLFLSICMWISKGCLLSNKFFEVGENNCF